jgi:predicted metalloprotease with PDZ domain
MTLKKETDAYTPFLGITLNNGRISSIQRGTSAYDAGLNVNDEILEINDKKIINLSESISDKKIGDIILVKVKRFGQEMNFNLVLKSNPAIRFKLEKIQNSTPEQESLYKKWLFIK